MKGVREYTVQTFDEFTEDEQKRILDKYRYINTDFVGWLDLGCYAEELNQMGFFVDTDDIYYDLDQGGGASFTCGGLDLEKLLADLDIKHKKFWIAYLKYHNMRVKDKGYRSHHKYTKELDVDDDCHIEWYTYDKYHPYVNKEYEKIKEHIEQKRIIACDWLYKALVDEMDYRESDEAVRDTIEVNEYMFDTRTLEIA